MFCCDEFYTSNSFVNHVHEIPPPPPTPITLITAPCVAVVSKKCCKYLHSLIKHITDLNFFHSVCEGSFFFLFCSSTDVARRFITGSISSGTYAGTTGCCTRVVQPNWLLTKTLTSCTAARARIFYICKVSWLFRQAFNHVGSAGLRIQFDLERLLHLHQRLLALILQY